ncbi:MAG TPA: IS200/IS605 family accessory protein TnpB-related protein, partial [Candidatus Babeliales bacterium]|nr:IS200/IS605 family accessory protein TnpB-related protein [Candidatus Babeliales bacterium]
MRLNGKNTSKKIQSFLLKREHKINTYFNQLVDWIFNTYKHKKKIIIGYNLNWKSGINMGSNMNKKFYQIPYCKLLNKIKQYSDKTDIEIVFTEESYTSKCDALSLEEVKKHDKYTGKRLWRGLFKSGTEKYINADLNGAINIMRKYMRKKYNLDLIEIKGSKLMAPVRAKIFRECTTIADKGQ